MFDDNSCGADHAHRPNTHNAVTRRDYDCVSGFHVGVPTVLAIHSPSDCFTLWTTTYIRVALVKHFSTFLVFVRNYSENTAQRIVCQCVTAPVSISAVQCATHFPSTVCSFTLAHRVSCVVFPPEIRSVNYQRELLHLSFIVPHFGVTAFRRWLISDDGFDWHHGTCECSREKSLNYSPVQILLFADFIAAISSLMADWLQDRRL